MANVQTTANVLDIDKITGLKDSGLSSSEVVSAITKSHNTSVINVKDFGAVGDGVTDDQPAIQLAIDECIRYGLHREIFMPSGEYLIGDTLHLGYGTYVGLTLRGEGQRYNGDDLPGTRITANFVDRPAIAITAARITYISDLAIVGKNSPYVKANKFGLSVATKTDLLTSDWEDPALTMSKGRYNPYAGIAIDPYTGSKPTEAYPDVTFPSWTGITTQYNKLGSSQIYLDNVNIMGFVCGVVLQPGPTDANGDFIHFNHVVLSQNLYGFSSGDSQTRQVGISNSLLSGNHTAYTTVTHGAQRGNLNNIFFNTNFDACIYWLDIDSSFGLVELDTCYSENCYAIVKDNATSSNKSPITFKNCSWNFGGQNTTYRGKPDYEFSTGHGVVVLENCSGGMPTSGLPTGGLSVLSVYGGIITKNCKFKAGASIDSTAKAIATNMCQNGIVPSEYDSNKLPSFYRNYDISSFGYSSEYLYSNEIVTNLPSRNITYPRPVNINTRHLSKPISYFAPNHYIPTSSWSSVSVSGITVSVNIGTSWSGRARYHVDLGDILKYNNTNYYVSSVNGNVIELTALNNYDKDGVLNDPIPASPSQDALYWHSRVVNLNSSYDYYLSFTAGSSTVNVRRASDDYTGDIETAFTVGDRLILTGEASNVFRATDAQKITATSNSSGTITMESNARQTRTDVLQFLVSRTFNS